MPQQPHHTEVSTLSHSLSVEASTEQMVETSSFAVLPLDRVEAVPLERAYACNTEQPQLGAQGTSLMAEASRTPAAPWTGSSYIPLSGTTLDILGEHPCPCQGFATSTALCSSPSQSCLSPANHSHSAVSKET